MKPEWATPPDGDFVRYVERLTAQAAARHAAQVHGHGIDDGAAELVPSHPAPSAAAARPPAAPAKKPPALSIQLLKNLAFGLVVLLVVLNMVFGVPLTVLGAIVVVVAVLVFRHLRQRYTAEDLSGWRDQLVEAARNASKKPNA